MSLIPCWYYNNEKHNSQLLPQDRALSREKGQPLCMAQYQRLFASYRTPGLEQDQLRSFPPPDENEHIIVAHQGQVISQPPSAKRLILHDCH